MVEYFQPASTDEDLLPVVDEYDKLVDVMPRRQVHVRGLRHRAVQICVVDPLGRIWLQQRSRAKDAYPLAWDWSATGHVDPGESYDEAARRELREELGIEGDPQPIVKVPASEHTGWEFHQVYWMRWDGALDGFNRAEIEQVRAFQAQEIRRALEHPGTAWPLTPTIADYLPFLLKAAGLDL